MPWLRACLQVMQHKINYSHSPSILHCQTCAAYRKQLFLAATNPLNQRLSGKHLRAPFCWGFWRMQTMPGRPFLPRGPSA